MPWAEGCVILLMPSSCSLEACGCAHVSHFMICTFGAVFASCSSACLIGMRCRMWPCATVGACIRSSSVFWLCASFASRQRAMAALGCCGLIFFCVPRGHQAFGDVWLGQRCGASSRRLDLGVPWLACLSAVESQPHLHKVCKEEPTRDLGAAGSLCHPCGAGRVAGGRLSFARCPCIAWVRV